MTEDAIEVRLGMEGGEAEVRQFDAASGSWSEWIEEGDFRRRIKGHAQYAEWSKDIRSKTKELRERKIEPEAAPVPENRRPTEEPLEGRINELADFLIAHPKTRLMDLAALSTAEGMRRYSLAKQLLDRKRLFEHPKTRALSFYDHIPTKDPSRSITVRFLREIKFVAEGEDIEAGAEDVRALPENIAGALIKGGAAVEVSITTPTPEDQPTAALGLVAGTEGEFPADKELEAPANAPSTPEAAKLTPRQRQDCWLDHLEAMLRDLEFDYPVLVQLQKSATDPHRVDWALAKWLPRGERRTIGRRPEGMTASEYAEARASFNATLAGPYFTRGILPFELVLDLDIKDRAEQEEQAALIRSYFTKLDWTIYELPTGGKGRHIHAFIDPRTLKLPDPLREKIARLMTQDGERYAEWRWVRVWFLRELHEAGVRLLDHRKGTDGIDKAKISWSAADADWRAEGSNHGTQVRVVGCVRPETGRTKTLDPEGRELRVPAGRPVLNDLTSLLPQIVEDLEAQTELELSRPEITAELPGQLDSIGCIGGFVENGVPESFRNNVWLRVATLSAAAGASREELDAMLEKFAIASTGDGKESPRSLISDFGSTTASGMKQAGRPDAPRKSCGWLRFNVTDAYCNPECPMLRAREDARNAAKGGELPSASGAAEGKEDSAGKEKRRANVSALRLVEMAKQGGRTEFFHDLNRVPFARVERNGHHEVKAIKEPEFSEWLIELNYDAEGLAPEDATIKRAVATLAVLAGRGEERPVFLRHGEHGGAFYYDLCNDRWQAVRITAEGWDIVDDPPVMFRRYDHMRPQAIPARLAGAHRALRELVKLANIGAAGRDVLEVQLIALNVPGIEQMGAGTLGLEGTGKTTTQQLAVAVADPSTDAESSLPDSLNDLSLHLSTHNLASFDNLTHITEKQSDYLSRAGTGATDTQRELYSNNGTNRRKYRTPSFFNGIEITGAKPDFYDRNLLYRTLESFDGPRLPKRKLAARIDELLPRALGEIFDILSQAMRCRAEFSEDTEAWTPRMVDWYLWALAVARAMGRPDGWFIKRFRPMIERRDFNAIADLPLTRALEFVAGQGGYVGTASELWAHLNDKEKKIPFLCQIDTRDRNWPTSVGSFGVKLRPLMKALRSHGVFIYKRQWTDLKRYVAALEGLEKARAGTNLYSYRGSDDVYVVSGKELDLGRGDEGGAEPDAGGEVGGE